MTQARIWEADGPLGAVRLVRLSMQRRRPVLGLALGLHPGDVFSLSLLVPSVSSYLGTDKKHKKSPYAEGGGRLEAGGRGAVGRPGSGGGGGGRFILFIPFIPIHS